VSGTSAPGAAAASAPVRNPLFPVGVDLYPLDAERASFSDWYDRDLADDFAAMAAGGPV
jgi:hypothetical protein